MKVSQAALEAYIARQEKYKELRRTNHVVNRDPVDRRGALCVVCGMELHNGKTLIVRTDVKRQVFGEEKPITIHKTCGVDVDTGMLDLMANVPVCDWPKYH